MKPLYCCNSCSPNGLIPSGMQFLFGFAAFLWPKYSAARRAQSAPIHHFAGRCVFVLGLATMAVGPCLRGCSSAWKRAARLHGDQHMSRQHPAYHSQQLHHDAIHGILPACLGSKSTCVQCRFLASGIL